MLKDQSTMIVLHKNVNVDCFVNYFSRYCKSITNILHIQLMADIGQDRSKIFPKSS